MLVKDMIKELQRFDPDAQVRILTKPMPPQEFSIIEVDDRKEQGGTGYRVVIKEFQKKNDGEW